MCGIAGQLKLNSIPIQDTSWVDAAQQKLLRRGPDSQGMRNFGTYAAAHTRLAIIDLSDAANQPFEDEKGILVFNGEIYNFQDLAREYRLSGLKTQSDTEVLFHLLNRPEGLPLTKLRGMFSFAYFDKAGQSLIMARDHLGQKPLYYGINDQSLFFSSKAGHVFEAVGGGISNEGLSQYKSLQLNFAGHTLFDRVFELPPGYFLEVKANEITLTRYWSPSVTQDNVELNEQHLSDLLHQSVARTLVADVSIGIALSGGLDSSLVAGVASTFGDYPLFHGRYFEEPDCDESTYALAQARLLNQNLQIVNLSAGQFDNDFAATMEALDVPCAGPGAVGQYAVSREVSRSHKVVLSGLGGDELFGGYARYFLMDEKLHQSPILNGYGPLRKRLSSLPPSSDSIAKYYSLISRDDPSKLQSRAYLDEFSYQSFREWIIKAVPGWEDMHPLKIAMLIDQLIFLPGLLHVEDGVTMNFGTEGRLPLIDVDLLMYANSLSLNAVLKNGPKYPLKRVAKRLVDPTILNRVDKMGFPLPLNRWVESGQVPNFMSFPGFHDSVNQWDRQIWGNASLSAFKKLQGLS